MSRRSWTVSQLRSAVRTSTSYRQVLDKLGLRRAGGNYAQVKKYINEHALSTSHFKGHAWNKGMEMEYRPRIPLKDILTKKSSYQTYKLKNRLIRAGIKTARCEECGWAKKSKDGRLPLELDHINGDSNDNRLNNLRILCPNCHSLKPTHRGKNRR